MVNCPICMNKYSNKFARRPKQLSCDHTICCGCLDQLIEKKCPVCRCQIIITSNNLSLIECIQELNNLKKEINDGVDYYLEIVDEDGLELEFIENQTFNICRAAIHQNGKALQFVKKQTSELCIEAVKQNGMALQFVNYQSKKICIEAVKENGMALEFVKKQTEKICLEAVKENGMAFEFVKKQTPQILFGSCEKMWTFIKNCR